MVEIYEMDIKIRKGYAKDFSYRRSRIYRSNLCEALLGEGHEVRCLDNFATGKIENLLPLLQQYPERFRLIVGDIRNPEDCRPGGRGDGVCAA